MLDMLMILPYNAAGQSIDWASDFVMALEDAEELPRRAKTRMAQGVTQAEAALRANLYRAIVLVDYEHWGDGTTEIWNLIENQRVFNKTRLRFAVGGPNGRFVLRGHFAW